MKTIRKQMEWERVQPLRCDLCNKLARWAHPLGGLRCEKCPLPKARKR